MIKIILGVVIVTIAVLVVMSRVDMYANGETIETSNVINYTSKGEDQISATISGEVIRPGTYILDNDTELADLVAAAGGLTTNADYNAFDLSYILLDNISFYIAPIYDNSSSCSSSPIQKVNINTDDKATLMTINAIGDTIASNIISYRETTEFYRLEDLKNVSGIGTATFEKIKNFITLK